MTDGAWTPMLHVSMSWPEVQAAIRRQIEIAIEHLHAQIDALEANTTIEERATIAARLEPVIRRQTREAMLAGWRDLTAPTVQ